MEAITWTKQREKRTWKLSPVGSPGQSVAEVAVKEFGLKLSHAAETNSNIRRGTLQSGWQFCELQSVRFRSSPIRIQLIKLQICFRDFGPNNSRGRWKHQKSRVAEDRPSGGHILSLRSGQSLPERREEGSHRRWRSFWSIFNFTQQLSDLNPQPLSQETQREKTCTLWLTELQIRWNKSVSKWMLGKNNQTLHCMWSVFCFLWLCVCVFEQNSQCFPLCVSAAAALGNLVSDLAGLG